MKDHQMSIHNPTTLRCAKPGCNYVAKHRNLLRAHRRKHQKPYQCVFPGCKQKFHNEVPLLKHQQLHDPNRPFHCEQCPQRYECKNNLKSHMKIHEEQNQLRCPFCNKSTKYSKVLRAHIKRLHPDVKVVSCSEGGCNYSSRSPLDIIQHIKRWHDRKRPFKCEGCSYRFMRKNYLSNHSSKCAINLKGSTARLASQGDPFLMQGQDAGKLFANHEAMVKHLASLRVPVVAMSRANVLFL